jgi:hypothetical protein
MSVWLGTFLAIVVPTTLIAFRLVKDGMRGEPDRGVVPRNVGTNDI